MSIVYGPDAFTTGSDTPLQTYDSNWSDVTGGGNITVEAAGDHLIASTGFTAQGYIWSGAGSPTGDQKITGDIAVKSGFPTNFAEYGFIVRATIGSGGTYYRCTYNGTTTITIDRVINGADTNLASATISSFTADVPKSCYFQAIGTGATVDLTFQVTGETALTYSDTAGNRITSGKSGVRFNVATVDLAGCYIDNVKIEDFSAGPGVPIDDDDLYALQINQGSQWSVSQW